MNYSRNGKAAERMTKELKLVTTEVDKLRVENAELKKIIASFEDKPKSRNKKVVEDGVRSGTKK